MRLFQESTVDLFTTRVSDESSRALGWDTPAERSSAGDFFTDEAFGHTGFTGTSIWMDRELDLFVILLTNRVNPTRANSAHVDLRRAVHDVAATAIADRTVGPREGAR
jgi:CubicO group peptidase (beta-lactamase class C family)